MNGNITGYYDTEWMPDEGIEKFETGKSYVVRFDDRDSILYNQVMYSRSELGGWLSLALKRYGEQFPDLMEEILKIETNYYSPEEVIGKLQKKITGEMEWAYGPRGHLSDEKRLLWKNNSISCKY